MPIRFRCAYCNQLMGIARRKAGTVVQCPTCAGHVIVPTPPGFTGPSTPEAGTTAPARPGNGATRPAGGGLFDSADIDQDLFAGMAPGDAAPPAGTARPSSASGSATSGAGRTTNYDVVPLQSATGVAVGESLETVPGIFLSRRTLLVLAGLVLVLVALAFALGWWAGSAGS